MGGATANGPHDNQDDDESATHDEFPPVEVRSPLVPQEIPQLLLNRIMARVGHSLGCACCCCGDDVLAVPKDELDLHLQTHHPLSLKIEMHMRNCLCK